jgi:sodium transport system permease protein
MRWSIIRVIWLRELRDQLRDRRTVFMIVVLPLLLYPLGALGLMQIAPGLLPRQSTVAVVGAEFLPRPPAFPALLEEEDVCFSEKLFPSPAEQATFRVRRLDKDEARAGLDSRQVDVVLEVPKDFGKDLQRDAYPCLILSARSDDRSLLAKARLRQVLDTWRIQVNKSRFSRHNPPLSERFDQPFDVVDEPGAGPPQRKPSEIIFDLLVRVFPFVLVLWSLAGALYPAVDLCAGEKERGTMETLLISPAQREEIVWGKFLTIWVFSGATALLNLLSMGVTSLLFGSRVATGTVQPIGFVWCVVLLLPLSAFFSALCLAVGAYARSSKEGQYYLMPLFLVTMPLLLLTLAPNVELNPFYSMVPVTGVALLLQKLVVAGTPDPTLWLYFVPVLVPMVIYGWLALRWAIIQFQREEVLFREAERLELGLWLKRLLREKEPRPSAGQALFCFTLVLGLSWFSLGLGTEFLATNIIRFIAFVATPTLMMALLLTTQPRQSLALRLPPLWSWPFTLVLVVVLTPPLAELTHFLLWINPNLGRLIEEYRPFTEWLNALRREGPEGSLHWWHLVVFAWLPALCEEVTFRGFILTGLQRRFRPRTAVLLSSFLFSLLHMNVFQFVPTFLLGVVLAYLTTRCGSILPSILFHLLYNTILVLSALRGEQLVLLGMESDTRLVVALACTPLAIALLWWLTRLWPHPAYVAFLASDPGLEPPFEAMQASDLRMGSTGNQGV